MTKKLTDKQIKESYRLLHKMAVGMDGDDSVEQIQKLLNTKVTLEDILNVFDTLIVPTDVKLNTLFTGSSKLELIVGYLAKDLGIQDDKLNEYYDKADKELKERQKKAKKQAEKQQKELMKALKEHKKPLNKKSAKKSK